MGKQVKRKYTHQLKLLLTYKFNRQSNNYFLICILTNYFLFVIIEAEFVNPKIVTNIPGPGAHDPNDVYTTKEHSSKKWSINKIERNPEKTEQKHPGPHEYNIPSKIVEKPEYGFGLKPFIDP